MTKSVYGISVGAPRVTRRAIWLAVAYFGLPLLGGLIAFDVLVWWVADTLWDVCIGLWCWI